MKIDLLAPFIFSWLRYLAASNLPVSAEEAAQCRRLFAFLFEVEGLGVLAFIGVPREKELVRMVYIICGVFEASGDDRRSRPTRKGRSRSDDRWMAIHNGRLDGIGWRRYW